MLNLTKKANISENIDFNYLITNNLQVIYFIY